MLKSEKHKLLHLVKPLVLIMLLALVQCSSDPLDVDVSDIKVDLVVERMEQDLFESDAISIEQTNQLLVKKYGFLYESFMMSMIQEGSPHDPMASVYLEKFITNQDMQSIYKSIKNQFVDFAEYETQFTEAFKHYKYYFPDSTLPRIITFYSNFNANVFPYEDNLAIGLDMYLGKDHEIVQRLPPDIFPSYLKAKMAPEYLVADGMKFWLFNHYEDNTGKDFLTSIVNLGKIMYLLDAMLPTEADHIKMGCSTTQMQWCKTNEKNIWSTIIDENILYSKDPSVLMQYISEGPFTKGFPHESPSKIGVWLGWQIVRDYMHKEEVSIHQLLKEKNPKKILKSYTQGDRE